MKERGMVGRYAFTMVLKARLRIRITRKSIRYLWTGQGTSPPMSQPTSCLGVDTQSGQQNGRLPCPLYGLGNTPSKVPTPPARVPALAPFHAKSKMEQATLYHINHLPRTRLNPEAATPPPPSVIGRVRRQQQR